MKTKWFYKFQQEISKRIECSEYTRAGLCLWQINDSSLYAECWDLVHKQTGRHTQMIFTANRYSGFDELSNEAKQKAINQCRPDEIFWADENRASMEKFAECFPIKVTDWSYGGRGEGVSFRFDDDNIEELSGQRLATWIWNNCREIWKGKYMGCVEVNHVVKHRRVRGKAYKNGNFFNPYYSAIFLDTSCPLTGYCMDDYILSPLLDFVNKPDGRNFRDLLDDCFSAWVKACNDDIEYQNSDEAIIETIKANEYTFEESGKLRNY